MKGKTIELTSGDGARIDCYHVEAHGHRRGGLILIMEIFGVTDHIRELCDGFAADGFEVLSPALYDRIQKGFEATYSQTDIQRSVALRNAHPMDNSIADIAMCADYLKPRGPVFVVGYCYGGGVAWVAAARVAGLKAVSSYYGRLTIEHIGDTPKCPAILHFGRSDASIPMEGVEKIAAAHPTCPVHVYEAGHGFNSDRRPDYHEPSARLARARTLAFISACG
jgi:carboxymethylenebutenolidase